MARGIFTAEGTISTNADTAVIAAPGAGERIYINWFTVTVAAAGTTSRLVIENGVNGAPIARMATATADALLNINYSTGNRNFPGKALTENTALNFETTGGAAATINYEICYEVK
jgi:hypothetical protein